MTRKVDRTLQIDDDLLCGLFSDTRNRREEFIIFELYRLHEIFSSESEEVQRCLPSHSVYSEQLTKKLFLIMIDKSEECLPCLCDMMVDKYL